MRNKIYLTLRMLTICGFFLITSTSIAQDKTKQGIPSTTIVGTDSVNISDIVYANQIFIEHKSFKKQVDDLLEVIRLVRMELDVEKKDGEMLRLELGVLRELNEDRKNLSLINEIDYKNTIRDLKRDNMLYKIITAIATLTAIIIVVTK